MRDFPFGTGTSRELEEAQRLRDGSTGGWSIAEAENHGYEAHGIGKRWMKIKRYLDGPNE